MRTKYIPIVEIFRYLNYPYDKKKIHLTPARYRRTHKFHFYTDRYQRLCLSKEMWQKDLEIVEKSKIRKNWFVNNITKFFNNYEKYENDVLVQKELKKRLVSRYKREIRAIPKHKDDLYIFTRIVKQNRQWMCLVDNIDRLVGERTILPKGQIYILQKNPLNTMGYCSIHYLVALVSIPYLKALVALRDSGFTTSIKPKYRTKDTGANMAYEAIKEFLADPKGYDSKYKVKFVSNGVYSTKWWANQIDIKQRRNDD